ncbi:MAG: hypothetical protein ABJE95_14390 [Byssovorax sp.]
MRWRVIGLLLAAVAAITSCGGIAVLEIDPAGASSATGTLPDPTLDCPQGRADCDGLAENGCEIDLAGDATSCGVCGHGCQGGPCQSGLCQPVIVASGQGYAYRLAATETAVYWTTSDGSVLRAPASGAPEILAQGQNSPGDLAVDESRVYWANLGDGTIVSAPLGGGAIAVVVPNAGQAWSLAVSATTLSWTDNKTGDVRALALVGNGPPILLATTPGAWAIAMDSTRVYWSTLFAGAVLSAPIGGGPTTTLVSGFTAPGDLALAGDRLFFGTGNDAGVHAVPIAGGVLTTLAATGGFGIAADEHHVYFGDYDGRLARVPLAGGEPEVIGIGPGTPTDLALSSTTVYWAAAAMDGLILKVAK